MHKCRFCGHELNQDRQTDYHAALVLNDLEHWGDGLTNLQIQRHLGIRKITLAQIDAALQRLVATGKAYGSNGVRRLEDWRRRTPRTTWFASREVIQEEPRATVPNLWVW